jgi:predicted alpha/beta hydrolase
MAARDIELKTDDGFALEATLYEPERPNGIALQINSAAATQRRFYRAFAEYLAGRGYVVLTYDYRGAFIESIDELRASQACMTVWGGNDQAAATRYLRATYPGHAIALLAHSMGGQFVGLSPAAGELAAVLLIAAGDGYWRRMPGFVERWRRALRMCVILPLAVRALGYLPASLGGGSAKSAVYARELIRFSRSPHYFCDESGAPLRPHHADVRVPLKLITISDDEVVRAGAELDPRELYPNARVELERVTPQRYGLERLGHFGLFRRSAPQAAWNDIAAWLERAVPTGATPA